MKTRIYQNEYDAYQKENFGKKPIVKYRQFAQKLAKRKYRLHTVKISDVIDGIKVTDKSMKETSDKVVHDLVEYTKVENTQDSSHSPIDNTQEMTIRLTKQKTPLLVSIAMVMFGLIVLGIIAILVIIVMEAFN